MQQYWSHKLYYTSIRWPKPKKPTLHIILNSQQERDTILHTAKELRNAGESYSNVYINKDIHPAVRKEIGRLKKKAKEESGKSENSESVIIYDPKNQVVKKMTVSLTDSLPDSFNRDIKCYLVLDKYIQYIWW